MSQDALAIGSLFEGRYEIRAIAGHGGMATVYGAFHQGLGRQVALKILRMRANLGLAKIDRRRLDDLGEERHLNAAAEEIAKMPVLRNNIQPDFIAARCSLYARLNKWDKVMEVADAERALSRHTKASLGIDWLRQWGEPYSMALRKHGRDSEANAILDRIDHYEKNTKAAGLLLELPPDVR